MTPGGGLGAAPRRHRRPSASRAQAARGAGARADPV